LIGVALANLLTGGGLLLVASTAINVRNWGMDWRLARSKAKEASVSKRLNVLALNPNKPEI